MKTTCAVMSCGSATSPLTVTGCTMSLIPGTSASANAFGFDPSAVGFTRIPATFQVLGSSNGPLGNRIATPSTFTVLAVSINALKIAGGTIGPSDATSASEISASASAFVFGTGQRKETSFTSRGSVSAAARVDNCAKALTTSIASA